MADRNAQLAARIAQVKPVPATVQLLEKQLLNGDAEIREQGVDSITKIQPPAEPLTDMLFRLLHHENWYVRRTTAAACTKCAELDETAEMAIHKVCAAQLEHEDRDVRSCVARALLAMQKSSVEETPPKSSALGIQRKLFKAEAEEAPSDDEPRTARSEDSMAGGAKAGAVDAEYGDLAVMEIAQRLAHEDPEIKELALTTLGQMGAAAAPYSKKIGQMLADDDTSVSVASFWAFEQLGRHAVTGIEEVVKILWHQQDFYRRQAHKTLLVSSRENPEEVVQHVIKCLGELQPRRKEEREKASGRRSPPGSKNSSEEAPVRVVLRAVLTLLCDLGPLQGELGGGLVAQHMKVIMPFIEDPDTEIRAPAIRCLIRAGPEVVSGNGYKLLRKKMELRNITVSKAAMDVLRGLAPLNPVIAGTIGQVLWEEPLDMMPETMRQRSMVLQVLGGSGENARKFLEYIAREMESSDFKVRRAAMEAFVDLKEHALPASGEIVKRLIHAEPLVRRLTVECVQLMGPHGLKLLPRVKGLLDTEEDPDVVHTIKRALEGKNGVAADMLGKPRRASIAGRRASLKSQRRGGVDAGN